MPESPATPAVRAKREAEQDAFRVCMTTDSGLYVPNEEMWHRLAAYRDAVAARVTEELLASGTPMHVATDGEPDSDPQFRTSAVFQREPTRLSSGDWYDSGDYGVVLHDVAALTPPGTVRQAVLLIPEATE